MKPFNIKPYAIEPRASIDLSLSENPLGCSVMLQEKLKRCSLDPSKYPQANGNDLKQALAKQFSCSEKNIFVTNGSESIIFTIPKTLAEPGNQAIMPQLTFPLFRMACECANLEVNTIPMKKNMGIDVRAIQKRVTDTTRLIFLCNPNNPTGMLLSRKEIIQFLNDVPENVIVVVDEANLDFGGESVIDQALQRKNIIVLRTFSKGFGLAGFRIGFAIGDMQIIQQMTEKTPPFPISSLSEQLAIEALSDIKFVKKSKSVMDGEREKIKKKLSSLGCTVFDSQANNIFAQLPPTILPEIFFQKLKDNDCSVVKGSKFEGCDDSFFRISPKSAKMNEKFLYIMGKILKL